MAQYAYYKIGNTNTQIKRVGWKVGNNTSTFRKVGWNNSVYVLESWWSCSANVPVSITYYTQARTIPTARHTFTECYESKTTYYDGVYQGSHTAWGSIWETNFELWDTDNNFSYQDESSHHIRTQGVNLVNSVYENGISKYTFDDRTDVNPSKGLQFTYWIRAVNGGNRVVQTASMITAETPVGGTNMTQKAEFIYEQSTQPNYGHINNTQIIDKYNLYPIIDDVHHSTTRYFLPTTETPFVWNTW